MTQTVTGGRDTPVASTTASGPSRLRLRRKLLRCSTPVLVLLVVLAAKLVSVPVLGDQLPGQFAAHDDAAMRSTLHWIEMGKPFRGYREGLAEGDMLMLTADFTAAHREFQVAHNQQPKACAPRANFTLVSEMLSDRELNQGNFFQARTLLEPAVSAASGDPGCFATFDFGASPIARDFVARTPKRVADKLEALKSGFITQTPDGYDYLRTPGGSIDLKGGGAPCETTDEAQLRHCIHTRDTARQRRLAEAERQAPAPSEQPVPAPAPGPAPAPQLPGPDPSPPGAGPAPADDPGGVSFPEAGPEGEMNSNFCDPDGTPLRELAAMLCAVSGPQL